MKNLVLVGFMGSGKTTIGRLTAVELGMQFMDMDRRIEEREGMSIPDIFAQRGESIFRDIEEEVVKELAARHDLVIATGGGVVLRPANVEILAHSGVVVHLRVDVETVLARTRGHTHRPLLQGEDLSTRARALLKERRPLYEAIPLFVESAGRSSETVTRDVVAIYRAQEKQLR